MNNSFRSRNTMPGNLGDMMGKGKEMKGRADEIKLKPGNTADRIQDFEVTRSPSTPLSELTKTKIPMMRYLWTLCLLLYSHIFLAASFDSLSNTQTVAVHMNGKDSVMEVVPDHTYGTGVELQQKIMDGELECYYVIENGKLYQKFRVLENSSFIEDYGVLSACIAILLGIVVVYAWQKRKAV